MEEIKKVEGTKCLFCGEDLGLELRFLVGSVYRVECKYCEATGPTSREPDRAEEIYRQRVDEIASLETDLAALEAIVEQFESDVEEEVSTLRWLVQLLQEEQQHALHDGSDSS